MDDYFAHNRRPVGGMSALFRNLHRGTTPSSTCARPLPQAGGRSHEHLGDKGARGSNSLRTSESDRKLPERFINTSVSACKAMTTGLGLDVVHDRTLPQLPRRAYSRAYSRSDQYSPTSLTLFVPLLYLICRGLPRFHSRYPYHI